MTKKKMMFLFIFACLLVFIPFNVEAQSRRIIARANERCHLRSDATGICIYSNTNFNALTPTVVWLDNGDNVVVQSNTPVNAPKTGSGSECPTRFVRVSYTVFPSGSVHFGWVCENNLWNGVIPEAHRTEFRDAGFPESYWESLSIMKTAHPNWRFVAIDTQLDFQHAVNNMAVGTRSLISGDQGMFSTAPGDYNWLTDTFTLRDSTRWYNANTGAIAYYLDPRNFLKNMTVFQFQRLSYNHNTHPISVNAVRTALNGAYIQAYSDHFMTAGIRHNINPVHLASLSRQEVGTTRSRAVSGEPFFWEGRQYNQRLYNFYNIGATAGTNPVFRGLVYANGGVNGTDRTFGRPWNTPEQAIVGGAEFVASRYVARGQDTAYFKKWNVVELYSRRIGIQNPMANFTHQYMQNIASPRSEGINTYRAYFRGGFIDEAHTFHIPVFRNMPTRTVLPPLGNPNNRLRALTVNSANVAGFAHDRFEYTVHVANNVTSVTVGATVINTNARTTGTGTVNLNVGDNRRTITVTAQNGATQNYVVNIIRAPGQGPTVPPAINTMLASANITHDGTFISNLTLTTNIADFRNRILAVNPEATVTITRGTTQTTTGNLRTGDGVTIVSGEESRRFEIVIFGDTNGDGVINALDLLRVQRHILGVTRLTGAQLRAADTNRDGVVNALDLLRVQRHILGVSLLTQN